MMTFSRDEAMSKVGVPVEIHHYLTEDGGGAVFSGSIPEGTRGKVVHANLSCRLSDSNYDHADFYEVVIEWDMPGRPISMIDKGDYEMFITDITGRSDCKV
jgi:hypothetical protein